MPGDFLPAALVRLLAALFVPVVLAPLFAAVVPALRRGLRAAVLSTVTCAPPSVRPPGCRVASAARLFQVPVHGWVHSAGNRRDRCPGERPATATLPSAPQFCETPPAGVFAWTSHYLLVGFPSNARRSGTVAGHSTGHSLRQGAGTRARYPGHPRHGKSSPPAGPRVVCDTDFVPESGKITVFLLDHHEVVRRGVHELLAGEDDIEVVGEAGTAADVLRGSRPRPLTSRSWTYGSRTAAEWRSAARSGRGTRTSSA